MVVVGRRAHRDRISEKICEQIEVRTEVPKISSQGRNLQGTVEIPMAHVVQEIAGQLRRLTVCYL